MKVLDLFAGIGGFTLGLERAGFETAAFCEIDPYAQKVLKKNWPEVPIYDDVRSVTAKRLISDGIRVDVITGGFPCQDISTAGRQAGIEGERSGLWSECARLIGEIQPSYAIFENVTNLLNGERGAWFKRVLWDISALGYDAEWHCIPASELGAHHHRDRVWIVAYPSGGERIAGAKEQGVVRSMQEDWSINDYVGGRGEAHTKNMADSHSSQFKGGRLSSGVQSQNANSDGRGHSELLADTQCFRQSRSRQFEQSIFTTKNEAGETTYAFPSSASDIWKAEPEVGRVADGVPNRSHRLKCLGNAVVPQIPELIGRAIMDHEKATRQ